MLDLKMHYVEFYSFWIQMFPLQRKLDIYSDLELYEFVQPVQYLYYTMCISELLHQHRICATLHEGKKCSVNRHHQGPTLTFPVNNTCISPFFCCFNTSNFLFRISISLSAVVRTVAIRVCSFVGGSFN